MGIKHKKDAVYPEHILIRVFEGTVKMSSIIESWEALLNSGLLTKDVKGVINDLNQCDLEMSLPDFKQLVGFLKNNEQLKKLKQAVVCNDPSIVVFPTLGQIDEQELKIRPFSSRQAAIDWILD